MDTTTLLHLLKEASDPATISKMTPKAVSALFLAAINMIEAQMVQAQQAKPLILG